jgi:hypothetical protein
LGKATIGFFFGLIVGLMFAPIIFPDGLVSAMQHWADNVRSSMPMH